MGQQRIYHRESSHRRSRYRHTETNRQRDGYDGTDRRRDLTDGRTTKRSSSRGSSSGSQYRHSSYQPYSWEGRSRVERSYSREIYYSRDNSGRERSYSRYRDNTREDSRESRSRCYSREGCYRHRSCDRERSKTRLREESPESLTTEYVVFPELWSTHMTEGDYLQLTQWRTEAIETETRSKAQSENAKGNQSLPEKSSRKRPLETATTFDEGPPPPKRPTIHLNRHYVRFGQLYRQSYNWNGYY